MRVEPAGIDGVLLFVPTPHRDDRGLFTRTFDQAIA
jgi:dTDP-4-dehydrorhamnose 3,5-epimerase